MPDDPFTPAELEAGAQAAYGGVRHIHPSPPPWPEFAADNPGNAGYFRERAAAVLAAVLPLHAARIRQETAAAVEHKWRVSTCQELGLDAESQLRRNAATAIIQSGYEDQDEEDPAAWDLLQWHPCRDDCGKCGCSGVPWISDQLWSTLGAVFAEHTRRVRRETAEGIAQAIEEADRHVDVTAAEMARTARAHATTSDAPSSALDAPSQLPTEGDQDG